MKWLLVVGFLVLAWGILAAWAAPANGYELSIYAATTNAFWVGAGSALLASVIAVAYGRRRRVVFLGYLLGGLAMTAILALPLVRGYRFYGLADPLTHLGWTKAMAAGELSAFELIYPGSHLASILIAATGGVTIERGMMLIVLASFVAYLVFIPLTVRTLIPDRTAVSIALFSALLILPLNNVGTHRRFFPYIFVTLLFPLLLYLLFKHGAGEADDDRLPRMTSAAGLVMPLVTLSFLFVHPQPTVNIIIFLGTISAVQFGYRTFRPDHRISRYRPVYGQTVFLAVAFLAWNVQFWQTYSMLDGLVVAIQNTVLGTGTAGSVVAETGQSASSIGVSIVELFFKLFFLNAVFVALAAALVVGKGLRALGQDHPDNHVAIAYFTFSGFTLGPFFLAHFLGDISHYFFRHVGFAMVLVTLLGASALYLLRRAMGTTARRYLRPFAVVATVGMLVLAVLAMYPSPYLYKHNHHAPDQLLDGYGETFAHAPDVPKESDEAVWFVGVRMGPGRYTDVHGFLDVGYGGEVPEAVLGHNLTTYYADQSSGGTDRDYYLPISEMARQREVKSYDGLEYGRESFDGIGNQPGVHQVRDNGDYTLYYIDTSTAEE